MFSTPLTCSPNGAATVFAITLGLAQGNCAHTTTEGGTTPVVLGDGQAHDGDRACDEDEDGQHGREDRPFCHSMQFGKQVRAKHFVVDAIARHPVCQQPAALRLHEGQRAAQEDVGVRRQRVDL